MTRGQPLEPTAEKACPICKGSYQRTYEEHSGSAKHLAAVRKATGRE